ncbi:MAG: hypothetical protein K0Q95_355 [Bacteroidota bacterium]|jgi:gliding motility-associated-like protein/uncharacterized repeat protein (TIGR01451 family)|nr:hypothetical protein [Bacteroidota bacterium]
MKNILIVLALVVLSFFSKAQTVTIPDQHFANWLNVHLPGAMSGNQLDTSNTQVKSLITMNVSYDTICNLEGIQYFTSLKELNCSNNKIDTLLNLPDSLKTLNCSVNRLIYIMELPDSLNSFDCSMNSLDSLPLLPVHLINFNCNSNSLKRIPALPFTITSFDCSTNQLDSLPALPPNIPALNCYENQLVSLPALPDSLISINCRNNLLSALPALPLLLRILDCSTNSLTSLPVLPDSLSELICCFNQLTALPQLPDVLLTLSCGNNLLTAIPALPSTLFSLTCNNNNLTNLPSLPASLSHLDCSFNSISTLPTLSVSLHYLDCSRNQLYNLPALTSSLCSVICSGNYLSNIPSLPGSLRTLICSNNPLINLPSLATLYHLDCRNCTLDSLPAIPASLANIDCSNNSIWVLPVMMNSVSSLKCDNNMLSGLPVLSPSLYELSCSNNNIHCFEEFPSSLQWLNIDNNPYSCLPNYLPVMSSNDLAHPLCVTSDTTNNPYNCTGAKGIVGYTFIDDNNSCLRDSLDVDLTNIALELFDSTGQFIGQTYTAVNGIYHFTKLPGVYEVRVDTSAMAISPQCANPGIDSLVTLTSIDPLVSNVNFGFNCKPGFDVGVRSVVDIGLVFPGETHELRINAGDMTQWYNMDCAAGLSGQVEVTINGPVSFSGIIPGALMPTVNANVFTYSIANFGSIINTQAFGLLLTVDPSAGDGDDICVSVNVSPFSTDRDTTNNSSVFCYNVVNSHDPNIKETYPEAVPLNYDGWLTYTVHFQNTGSAPAINIALKDTLDSQLDLSTFQATAYSHNNQVVLNGNALLIVFPHINLTDSTSHADSSKGYFQYRIKPLTGLGCGTEIHNTASIYFDFNAPVVTNTTTNAYPSFPEPLVISDTSVCNGSSLTLNLFSEGNHINWYDSNNSLLLIGNTLNLQNLTMSAVIHVQAISDEGCNGSVQSMNVTVAPPVTSPITSVEDTLCITDSLLLTASTINGWSYHWSGPVGFNSSLEDPQLSELSEMNSGYYQLYVSNGDCRSDTSGVYIQIEALPYIQVTNNPYICFGDNVDLSAHGNLRQLSWSNRQHTETINVAPVESSLYTVSGSNACGSLWQNILVTVYELPVAVAFDATLLTGEATPLHAEGGSSYSWYPGNGLSCSDCADPIVAISESQYYTVTVTDEHGCMDTTDLFVNVVEEKNTAYIPNSFTPNGDGLNDEFNISGTNIQDLQMVIYERSGEKMYESKGRNSSWNGTLKTQELGAGTYVYTVRIIFEDGSIANKKGYVTVVR